MFSSDRVFHKIISSCLFLLKTHLAVVLIIHINSHAILRNRLQATSQTNQTDLIQFDIGRENRHIFSDTHTRALARILWRLCEYVKWKKIDLTHFSFFGRTYILWQTVFFFFHMFQLMGGQSFNQVSNNSLLTVDCRDVYLTQKIESKSLNTLNLREREKRKRKTKLSKWKQKIKIVECYAFAADLFCVIVFSLASALPLRFCTSCKLPWKLLWKNVFNLLSAVELSRSTWNRYFFLLKINNKKQVRIIAPIRNWNVLLLLLSDGIEFLMCSRWPK